MNVIRSHLHNVYTEEVNKVALSAEDDKRVIMEDGIHTLAYGHYSLKEEDVRLGGRHNIPPPLLTIGQFRAKLWSGGKHWPRPMYVPNLKGVAFSICEILAHFAALH